MEFLHNDKETFCHAINLVTSKNGLSTEIVEKDYYVTITILNIEETRSRRDYNQYQIAYNPVQDIIDADVPPTVILETSYTAVSSRCIQNSSR